MIESLVDQYIPPGSLEEQWDPDGLSHARSKPISAYRRCRAVAQGGFETQRGRDPRALHRGTMQRGSTNAKGSRSASAVDASRREEVMLKQLDNHWKEHLGAMDYLRQGIGLRSATRKKIRSRNTSAKRSRCSVRCSTRSNTTRSASSRAYASRASRIARMDQEPARAGRRRLEFKHAEASALGQQPGPRRVMPRRQSGPVPAVRRPVPAAAQGAGAIRPRRSQGRPQRTLSLRVRQEVQAVPRQAELSRQSERSGRRGILRDDADGRVLIAERLGHAVASMRHYWEFPGGKIGRGRVRRRTHARPRAAEELGIVSSASTPFHVTSSTFTRIASVSIDFFIVSRGREGLDSKDGPRRARGYGQRAPLGIE